MSAAMPWECPHCNRPTTINNNQYSVENHYLVTENAVGRLAFVTRFTVCPNPMCRQPTCEAALHEWTIDSLRDRRMGKFIRGWRSYPDGASKPFPEYVPAVIRNDYREACLIVDLSPKASATLSRRCLQGILRDFWKVTPGNLWQEIQQIHDKTDEVTWQAIDAVRQIGNIGAHMEKDIDVIVDVDPGEAEMLIRLVETLLTEWYVGRHTRAERMRAITAVAAAKKGPPKE